MVSYEGAAFRRSAAQRANFTRMAVNPLSAPNRAAFKKAKDIEQTAETIARSEFGSESKYAGDFDTDLGPIISIDGQKRITFRVVNKNSIASIVEAGPKNPGPRPQGGSSGNAHHVLGRAAQANAFSSIRHQG